jgi:hypothetical protein
VGEGNPESSRTCGKYTIGLVSHTKIRGGLDAEFQTSYHINPECNADKEILGLLEKSLNAAGMELVPSANPIPIEYLGPILM